MLPSASRNARSPSPTAGGIDDLDHASPSLVRSGAASMLRVVVPIVAVDAL
jgi:hypothetical protein